MYVVGYRRLNERCTDDVIDYDPLKYDLALRLIYGRVKILQPPFRKLRNTVHARVWVTSLQAGWPRVMRICEIYKCCETTFQELNNSLHMVIFR